MTGRLAIVLLTLALAGAVPHGAAAAAGWSIAGSDVAAGRLRRRLARRPRPSPSA